jgi:hypothetical protein
MPMHEGHWVPHSHCTVTSGECFYQSKCLGQCTAARKRDQEDRIRALEHRVAELSKLVYPALHPRGIIAPPAAVSQEKP